MLNWLRLVGVTGATGARGRRGRAARLASVLALCLLGTVAAAPRAAAGPSDVWGPWQQWLHSVHGSARLQLVPGSSLGAGAVTIAVHGGEIYPMAGYGLVDSNVFLTLRAHVGAATPSGSGRARLHLDLTQLELWKTATVYARISGLGTIGPEFALARSRAAPTISAAIGRLRGTASVPPIEVVLTAQGAHQLDTRLGIPRVHSGDPLGRVSLLVQGAVAQPRGGAQRG